MFVACNLPSQMPVPRTRLHGRELYERECTSVPRAGVKLAFNLGVGGLATKGL